MAYRRIRTEHAFQLPPRSFTNATGAVRQLIGNTLKAGRMEANSGLLAKSPTSLHLALVVRRASSVKDCSVVLSAYLKLLLWLNVLFQRHIGPWSLDQVVGMFRVAEWAAGLRRLLAVRVHSFLSVLIVGQ